MLRVGGHVLAQSASAISAEAQLMALALTLGSMTSRIRFSPLMIRRPTPSGSSLSFQTPNTMSASAMILRNRPRRAVHQLVVGFCHFGQRREQGRVWLLLSGRFSALAPSFRLTHLNAPPSSCSFSQDAPYVGWNNPYRQ
jgi:hypothetical protein